MGTQGRIKQLAINLVLEINYQYKFFEFLHPNFLHLLNQNFTKHPLLRLNFCSILRILRRLVQRMSYFQKDGLLYKKRTLHARLIHSFLNLTKYFSPIKRNVIKMIRDQVCHHLKIHKILELIFLWFKMENQNFINFSSKDHQEIFNS